MIHNNMYYYGANRAKNWIRHGLNRNFKNFSWKLTLIIWLFLENNQYLTLEMLSRLSQFSPPRSFVGVPLGVILVGVVTICGDTNGDKSTSVRDDRLLFRLLLLGLCWRWLPKDTFGSFLIIWSLGISCFFVFWIEELSDTWLYFTFYLPVKTIIPVL